MRVFVTGATGFIGTEITRELIAAGHQVIGLCRSEDKAPALAASGAEVHQGTIEDADRLRSGVAKADAVIHLAFNHDFSRFAENAKADERVIATLGAALAGSNRPLIVTSGVLAVRPQPGRPAREDDPTLSRDQNPRIASEEAAFALAKSGVNAGVMRLSQIHTPAKQGLITPLIAMVQERGVFPYIGEGGQRWAAAHLSDTARLYRLAIERAAPGAIYHAVGEEGVRMRDIAETIAGKLGVPTKSIALEQAPEQFGWLAMFAGLDAPSSSEKTRQALSWEPTGPGLIADLERLEIAR